MLTLLFRNTHLTTLKFSNPRSTYAMASHVTRLQIRQAKPKECICCTESKSADEFPDDPPTEACDHPVRTCYECLNNWIHIRLRNSYTPNLQCPDCDQPMLGTKNLAEYPVAQERYFKIYKRVVKGRTPGWRWCLEEGCPKGSVHETLASQRQEEDQTPTRQKKVEFLLESKESKRSEEKSPCLSPKKVALPFEDMDIDYQDVWTCRGKTCAGQACAVCDRPWHEGLTCSEYAWRNMRHLVEDALSLRVIAFLRSEGRIKDCPNCQCAIEKDGLGRDVFCTRCLRKFRWDEV